MNIPARILAAIAVLLIVAVAFGLTMAVRSYLRYRAKRVITCPETANHAAVHVNVVNAAREAAFGKQHIRLDQCSRWPERQNCGQECLSQIEADPKGCMVWHMVPAAVSIPNGWWIADGNVEWVASMFPWNPRRIFRRNQPAATK